MKDFKIIGNGEVGDKARQLIEKNKKLKTIGFNAPKRIAFSQDFFDEYLQYNNLGKDLKEVSNEEITQEIKQGKFSQNQSNLIAKLLKNSNQFLAIRSSACGDSRGTGIYNSQMVFKNPENVLSAIKNVFASYFTKDAIAFRKQANSENGFGEIIEPVIGQWLGKSFAPIYSGHGYTSTPRSKGWIKIVNGLGGGVDTRDYLHIDREKTRKIQEPQRFPKNNSHWEKLRKGRYREVFDGTIIKGDRFHFNKETKIWELKKGNIFFKESTGDFQKLNNIYFQPLFNTMEEMENRFKSPQYFEFALTANNWKFKYWITQISEINKKTDEFNFLKPQGEFLQANQVLGNGKRNLEKIIHCGLNSEEVVEKFNKENFNYGIIYNQILMVGENTPFANISNASFILEYSVGKNIHMSLPLSHWGGALEETGKFFGVLNKEKSDMKQLGRPKKYEVDGDSIEVYNGNFEVQASEKQNILIVKNLNNKP